MKKRILIFLAALLCLICVFTLVACDEGGDETPAHQHRDADDNGKCDTCAEDYTDGIDVIPDHTHAWGEWIEITSASCMAKGIKMRACACGQSDTVYIDELPHALSNEWEIDENCHWQICTNAGCGAAVYKNAHAYDEENTCSCSHYTDDGVIFTLENDTYSVSFYTGTAAEVIIPSNYKGIAVTSIGYQAFFGNTTLTSVAIPSSVTSIGSMAFEGCSSLTSLTIPPSVTSIDYSTFARCSSLTSITIPSSVTSIGVNAFCGCTGLTAVTISEGVTSIDTCAFAACYSLTSVTIPSSVTTIGECVFYDCSGLSSIVVTSGNPKYHSDGNCLIETATKTIIEGCKNSVIPADGSVTTVYGFRGCTSLTSITIPACITDIGSFSGCTNLASVTFAANSQLTSIGWGTFEGCTNLTSITIPANVTSIGISAFAECTNLTSITIPASVTSIDLFAFEGCTGLTSVTFENPNGWGYSDLADTTVAATYLKATYSYCHWSRS